MNRIRLFPKDFLKAAFSIGLPIALRSCWRLPWCSA